MKQFFISCKESRIEHNRSFYGSFCLGPFEGGQSLTIANALRRTLLSELKGLAIVSIQIEGVLHEYSSLPGIKDSVLDILLNLKEIHFSSQMPSYANLSMLPQIGYLRVRGPGIVRASDLKLPAFIQLVDPEQYIATLAEDGFLNMKFVISEGKNYIIQKLAKKQKKSKGLSVKADKPFYLSPETLNKSPLNKELDNPNFEWNSGEKNITKKRSFLLKKIKQLTGIQISSLHPSFIKQFQNEKKKNSSYFLNSNPLTLDSVFAPVTKVNYIIEYSEHKTVETSFSSSEEINKLFNYLKPLKSVNLEDNSNLNSTNKLSSSLSSVSSSLNNNRGQNKTNVQKLLSYTNLDQSSLPKNQTSLSFLIASNSSQINSKPNQSFLSLTEKSVFASKASSHKQKTTSLVQSSILNSSLNEILEIKNSLTSINLSKEYVKPSSLKHNIIIEIWTNGSIHPREALYQGLKNLVKVFSNLYNVPGVLKTPILNANMVLSQAKDHLCEEPLGTKLQHSKVLKSYSSSQKMKTLSKNLNIIPLNNTLFSSNYTILSLFLKN